jgi:cell division septation protein DedD
MGSQITQSFTAPRRKPAYLFAGTLLAASLLAGCDDQGKFSLSNLKPSKNTAQVSVSSGPTVERDVEAPEVFSVTDQGLWDGRPSLGGIWVAHPDVDDPERVIIRNQSNDKFVVGALFRRERDIPGPSLQISSDAAAALGILAGAPVSLNVTALRKTEEPVSQPLAAQETTEAQEGIKPAPEVKATPLDPISAAGAAIDAAEATPIKPVVAATAAKPTPTTPAKKSSLSKPFIQIGIFSREANANRVAKQMRSAGLSTQVKQSTINGKTFWRAVVGPANTSSERSNLLSTVKSEGFTDAYAVSN